jgi:hypothetical protein
MSRVDRRTKLKPDEKALLKRLQHGTWALSELEWLERHLPADTPTLLVGEIRARLQALGLVKHGRVPPPRPSA